MYYYNPTSKSSCEEMVKRLKENGHEASFSTHHYTIERKTSKYNKYMKWRVEIKTESGQIIGGDYFKSKPQAIKFISRWDRPMPIGNYMVVVYSDISGLLAS